MAWVLGWFRVEGFNLGVRGVYGFRASRFLHSHWGFRFCSLGGLVILVFTSRLLER